MNFPEYMDLANTYMLRIVSTFDLAVAAEKLMKWDNLGADNLAWQEGPYISTGANHPDLSHDYPYCMRSSIYMRMVGKLLMGDEPEPDKHGGVHIPYGGGLDHTEPLMARLTIIVQHSLLEAYEFSCYEAQVRKNILQLDDAKFSIADYESKGVERLINGRVEHFVKRYRRESVHNRISRLWSKLDDIDELPKSALEDLAAMSELRNSLVHEHKVTEPTMKEAINYFFACRHMALQMGVCLRDMTAFTYEFPTGSMGSNFVPPPSLPI